jgi:hypothetical protein
VKTRLLYALGWAAFGLGWLLQGLARVRTTGVGWLALGFLGSGVGMVVLAALGYASPEQSGAPSEPGVRLYAILLGGAGLLAVGVFELALTF